MRNKAMRVCCLLLTICMAAAWIPSFAEEYTIDNIRQYVADRLSWRTAQPGR